MDVGLMIRYGNLVPGREAQAIELFQESVTYFEEKLKAGSITFFEPFLMRTSDFEEETGFFLVKGPAPAMFAMMEEEPYLRLMQKGLMLVEHLRADILTVGEGIVMQLERAGKVRAELGI
jgi:hypothetical protein